MIKAILFDADGVLFDSFEGNLKFFQDLLGKFGHAQPTREEFMPYFGSNMRTIIKDFSKLERDEEIDTIWKAGKDRVVPYPMHLLRSPEGLEEAIKTLNENYTLGVVTSRAGDNVFETQELKGLMHLFKVVVGYLDTDQHKPHPAPLLFALGKLGLNPDEAIYVGDTPTDVAAARAAGMKVISFGADIPGSSGFVMSFNDLPEMIKKI